MCWSGEASASLAVIGLSVSAYMSLKKRPEPPSLWVPLLYFSVMEVIQAFAYTVINQCNSPFNQLLTLVAFFHIAFQPFFVNSIALYFLPKDAKRIIAPWVYLICFLSSISMLIQLYPFEWAGHCAIGQRPLCGDRLCTVSGEWHIAWLVPANGIGDIMAGNLLLAYGWIGYSISCFSMPLIYGSWRVTLFTMLFGPSFAMIATNNLNEQPAVWCLYSIALCLAIIKTPLRGILFVSRPWWLRIYNHLKSEL